MTPPSIFGAPLRRRLFAWLVLLGAAQAALAACAALALGAFLTESAQNPARTGALIFAAAAAGLFLHAWGRSMAETLGQKYVMVYRVRLLKAIVRSGGGADRYGLTMTRLIADLASIKNWVSRGIADGAVSVTALCVYIVAAYWISPNAALAIGLMAAISVLVVAASAAPLQRAIRATRRARGALAAKVGEAVLMAPTLRVFASFDREKRRVYRRSDAVADNIAARWWWATLARRAPEFATPMGVALLFSTAPVAEAAAGAVLLSGAAMALRTLAVSFDYWLNFREGAMRLAEGLALSGASAEPWAPEGPVALIAEDARLAVGDKRANFEAPAGARVAIEAGDDAERLLNAIAGLAAPVRGRLWLVDATGARRLANRTNRAAALVSPRIALRRGTALENLREGAPDASEDRIREIAAKCDLLRGEETAETGLSWRIAEAGRGLDASRAARLRLARAVAASPGLLLIDDPVFEIDAKAKLALSRTAATETATIVFATFGDAPPIEPTMTIRYGRRRYRLSALTGDAEVAA